MKLTDILKPEKKEIKKDPNKYKQVRDFLYNHIDDYNKATNYLLNTYIIFGSYADKQQYEIALDFSNYTMYTDGNLFYLVTTYNNNEPPKVYRLHESKQVDPIGSLDLGKIDLRHLEAETFNQALKLDNGRK